jgi:integrase/recombinase XerD
MDDDKKQDVVEGELVTALQPLETGQPVPADVYLSRLAPGSRKTMRAALRIVAGLLTDKQMDERTMPWHLLRYENTSALRETLREKYAIASVNKMLAAIRQILKTSWRLGLMSAEDYQRAADVGTAKGWEDTQHFVGRMLKPHEITSVLAFCQGAGARGLRASALVAVLLGGGLRRFESTNLDVSDYNREERSLKVRQGKGRKERLVYMPSSFCSLLDAWLGQRGRAPGPLLCYFHIGLDGVVSVKPDHRLSAGWAGQEWQWATQGAGVLDTSSHDGRRTFASTLLEQGVDLGTVQKLLGHANIGTTTGYDKRGEETKREAVERLSSLYRDEKGT